MAGPVKMQPLGTPLSGSHVQGLTGDVRVLNRGQSAQLIDCQWDSPRVFLVTGQSSGGIAIDWTLRTGIDRAQLATTTISGSTMSRVILARSVQLTAVNGTILDNCTVSAIVVPVDASVSVVDILGTTPSPPEGAPNVADVLKFATVASPTATSFTNSYAAGTPFSIGHYVGATIYNVSPAGRNLFLALGAYNPVANDTFAVRIVPNAYYEVPFGYNGEIRGTWDGADAAGFALTTFTGFLS